MLHRPAARARPGLATRRRVAHHLPRGRPRDPADPLPRRAPRRGPQAVGAPRAPQRARRRRDTLRGAARPRAARPARASGPPARQGRVGRPAPRADGRGRDRARRGRPSPARRKNVPGRRPRLARRERDDRPPAEAPRRSRRGAGREDTAASADQDALTRFRRLATVELPHRVDRYPTSRYSLLELAPQTGRRHQIRRHLDHVSHPIVGDSTYGKGRHNRLFAEQFGVARLLLACVEVRLPHPPAAASPSSSRHLSPPTSRASSTRSAGRTRCRRPGAPGSGLDSLHPRPDATIQDLTPRRPCRYDDGAAFSRSRCFFSDSICFAGRSASGSDSA